MSLSDFIRSAETRLTVAGIDNPSLDARILIAQALHLDRAQLLSRSARVLEEPEIRDLDALIARRSKREPVGRILGAREFWSLSFGLNEATLEPRPDSETLVEAGLNVLRRASSSQPLRILDLGTGTGCLLLALLHELPNATGLGIDRAARAVEQATKNAEQLDLKPRAEFKVNDWLTGIDEPFDLIISNPPYIAEASIPTLIPEVRAHDPLLALNGGTDGLAAYRLLIPALPRVLKPNGFAVFEIGDGQTNDVTRLFESAGFKNIQTRRDLNGIERCLIANNVLAL